MPYKLTPTRLHGNQHAEINTLIESSYLQGFCFFFLNNPAPPEFSPFPHPAPLPIPPTPFLHKGGPLPSDLGGRPGGAAPRGGGAPPPPAGRPPQAARPIRLSGRSGRVRPGPSPRGN